MLLYIYACLISSEQHLFVYMIVYISTMAPAAFSCTSTPYSLNLLGFSTTSPSLLIKNSKQQQQPNWASLTTQINTHVLKHVEKTPIHPSMMDPMQRLLSTAPLSIAPAVCLAACELVSGQKELAMNAACAIQLMHAATHSHSHLLKHVDRRSGFDVMAGDGLLPLGYEMVTRGAAGDVGDAERRVKVVVEISRAMGGWPGGVLEGQLMEAEGIKGAEKEWAWERRGGRLSACGAACGAILGGGREEEVERLRRFGMYVGIINEILAAGDSANEEASQVFSSLARLELQGFQEGRVEDVLGLFHLQGLTGDDVTSLSSSLSS